MTGEVNLTNVFMQAPSAMAILEGPEHVFRLANEKYMQLVGVGRDIIGLPVRKALPETAQAGFLELLDDVYRTGNPFYGQEVSVYLDRRGTGQLQQAFVDFVYQPYLRGNGEIIGVLVHAVDITEQVLSRKKVEQSEQRLRNLISEAHVATAVYTGREMKIEYANDAMIRLWGKDRSVIGKTLRQALPELEGQPFHELLDNVFMTGKMYWGKEDRVDLMVDGKLETGYFNFTYKPLRNVDGQIYGILNMAIDVTEQFLYKSKVEELVAERTAELADANLGLQRSNDELSQFAYIASHDLQEPARKIATYIELLEKSITHPDTRSEKYIEKIDSAATRMLTLIRDVLTFSQVSTGSRERSTIDLNKVLSDVQQDFELTIMERQASIESDHLPTIEGIPVQISQLFGNLISNALKFSHNNRKPRITIRSRPVGQDEIRRKPSLNPQQSYYQIDFIDNGIGFNQSNADQIFDIFKRLHGKGEFEGTGIGLAICKKIAQNHNGDIWAESVKGEGATFHVILPTGSHPTLSMSVVGVPE